MKAKEKKRRTTIILPEKDYKRAKMLAEYFYEWGFLEKPTLSELFKFSIDRLSDVVRKVASQNMPKAQGGEVSEER